MNTTIANGNTLDSTNEQVILLVSPYESNTHNWQAILFKEESEADTYMHNHDLTKEHWIISTDNLVGILQQLYN